MAHPYMMTMNRNRMNGAHVETPARSIVRWTDEEKLILARAVRKLRVADPGMTNLEAVRAAQEQSLPENRQRPLAQERQIVDIIALMRDIAIQEKAAQSEPAPELARAAHVTELRALLDDIPLDPADPDVPANPETHKGRPTLDEIRADQQKMIETKLSAPATPISHKRAVQWTAEERRKIAVESKRLLNGFEDMSRLEAIRKAIEYSLPAERHRSIDAMANVPWIEAEWKQIDEQARAEQDAREAREQAAELERHAEAQRRATEAARAEAEKAKSIDPASATL
ncbi:hypothetical protein [Burkholderia pseudomallei]|uniref:hypothetical protein n=1 Tax=Burkholderia pseudomallei TaxID=28450 RepID=UPI0011AB859D|nr:hypothetical protein [Burkholderia pseudomallei]